MLYDHSVAEGLFSLEQTFAWPPAERMPAMCRELQGLGCCAFSFQRMLTAFLFATCRIDAAVVASSLTSACEAAGTAPMAARQHLFKAPALCMLAIACAKSLKLQLARRCRG